MISQGATRLCVVNQWDLRDQSSRVKHSPCSGMGHAYLRRVTKTEVDTNVLYRRMRPSRSKSDSIKELCSLFCLRCHDTRRVCGLPTTRLLFHMTAIIANLSPPLIVVVNHNPLTIAIQPYVLPSSLVLRRPSSLFFLSLSSLYFCLHSLSLFTFFSSSLLSSFSFYINYGPRWRVPHSFSMDQPDPFKQTLNHLSTR